MVGRPPASLSRIEFIAIAFWRITKSSRIRCVAKKLSVPCWIHSENKVTGEVSRVGGSGCLVLVVVLITCSLLLHCSIQLKYIPKCDLCQDRISFWVED